MNFNIFKRKEKRTVQNDLVDIEKLERIFGTDFKFSKQFSKKPALSLSAFYSQMPIEVKSVSTNTKLEQLALNRIFKKNKMTKFMLIKQVVSDVILYGNGYALIEKSTDGMVVGLTYLPGDQVTIYHNEASGEFYFLYKGMKIEDKDILHFYKNTYDGVTGISLLKFANRTIYLANSAEDAAADYFSSGMNINAIIHATAPLTQHQARQAVDSMNTLGLDNTSGTGRIRFLPFDLKLEPISQNAEEAQLTDTRLFNVSDIARFFNIPPAMLLDNNRNTADINLQFLTQCLAPWIALIEEELDRKLIFDDDLYFDLDEKSLLRTDLKSTAEYYNTLVSGGILTIKEVRDLLGFETLEGTDKLIVPYTDTEQNTINKTEQEDEQ